MKEYSRYSRQLVLKEIGREGQRKLESSRVVVIGVGALGSVSANLLARAGVGTLRVIDRDYLEMNNLQRQVLFDEKDLQQDLPKAIAAQRRLEKINSEIRIEAEVADVNADTLENIARGADLIVDGTDNFETRFLINDFSLKTGIPWIYGGAVRTEGMSYVILPGQGPCLRCLFRKAPETGSSQTCDQVGILAPVAHLIASFQTIEAIKILAGKKDAVDRKLWKVDLWDREFKAISVEQFEKAPCSGCAKKEYPYLERKSQSRVVPLCGRNAVQIFTDNTAAIDLKALAGRLGGQAEVHMNDYLLRCKTEDYEITVFPNGRAIIKGTEDAGQATSLYARYVGV